MERIGVLPNCWNGPIKREHLSEQRHAWSREKNQTHQELLSQHDTLAAELKTVSSRHVESLEIDKTLQGKIKALHSHQDISSKQEIKMLQKQIEGEKEKMHALKIERTSIKKSSQELKDSGLNGSCINGRRPTSSSQASIPVPMPDNTAPHLDTEKSPDSPPNHDVNVLNEYLEVPNTFCFFGSQYLKFNSFFLEDLADSSANIVQYFNQNYPLVLENGPLESTDMGFSGAS